jgi:hypothetical protein
MESQLPGWLVTMNSAEPTLRARARHIFTTVAPGTPPKVAAAIRNESPVDISRQTNACMKGYRDGVSKVRDGVSKMVWLGVPAGAFQTFEESGRAACAFPAYTQQFGDPASQPLVVAKGYAQSLLQADTTGGYAGPAVNAMAIGCYEELTGTDLRSPANGSAPPRTYVVSPLDLAKPLMQPHGIPLLSGDHVKVENWDGWGTEVAHADATYYSCPTGSPCSPIHGTLTLDQRRTYGCGGRRVFVYTRGRILGSTGETLATLGLGTYTCTS